jgi:DNA-binding transcriptional MerR regulator
MQTKQFRIGELSRKLCVEKFVIRFWEKEFNIKSQRSNGQQRFYTEKEFEKFSTIKDLLYHKGFTIAGAKKQIYNSSRKNSIVSAVKTTLTEPSSQQITPVEELKKLRMLLLRLHELL